MATVLIVDDEKGMRHSLGRFLQSDGHEVHAAPNAHDALKILESQALDIVLCDIIMPRMSGIELMHRISDQYPEIKVIMITGEPTLETALEAVRAGAFDYLTKPVDRSTIRKIVQTAARIKQLEEENRRYQQDLEQQVSERTAQLLSYTERLKQLSEQTRRFATCRDLQQLANKVMDTLSRSMNAAGGSFYIRNNGQLKLLFALDAGHQQSTVSLPPSPNSVIGKAMRDKQAFVVESLKKEANLRGSGWGGYENDSLLILPLKNEKKSIIGVLAIHDKETPPFTEQDLELGRIVEAHAVDAIRNIELSRVVTENERKYRELAENSQTGIYVHQHGKLVYANQRMADILEFDSNSLKELMAADVQTFVHPDDRAMFEQFSHNQLRGGDAPQTFELRLISRKGQIIWANVASSVVTYNSENAIMGNLIDITDRKRAEEVLLESEKRYRTLFESAGDAIFLMENDRIVDCNNSTLRMLRATRRDVLGATTLAFSPQLQSDSARSERLISENIKRALDGDSVSFEWRFVRLDGTIFDADVTINRLSSSEQDFYLLAIIRDITDRRIAEEAVKQSEKRYRLLVENAPIGILSMDRHGNITSANPALVRILGSPSLEDTLKINMISYTRMVNSGLSEEIVRCMKEGEIIQSEHPYTSKWGKKLQLRYYITPIKDETDTINGCLVLVEDFSEFNEAQLERDKLEEQLRQSQKMEAIGRLAGGVAHDFNNLLTGISGNASLALLDLPPDNPLCQTMNEIAGAAGRAAELTKQLLAFSRKQIIEPKILDLNELIQNLHRMLARLIGEDIQLETEFRNSPCTVLADAGQIEQVLINLAINARDAMPKGGTLTIETKRMQIDKSYFQDHPSLEIGDYAVLTVTDTGQGMDLKTKERLFEPFFTTKPQGRGTGLGLATTYGIIKQHNGFIEADSEPNQGSAFTLYLPYNENKPVKKEKSDQPKMPTGTETILVVEDESIVRKMAVKILNRQGYHVLFASEGNEALQIAKDYDKHIDLLMTDVVMPNMNGRELSEQLTQSRPELRVLFTSGYTEDVVAHHGVLDEGVHFVNKPYSPETLARKVREVLDKV